MIVAWHGDPALKAEVAARMRQHREHDEIVQGLYQLVNPKYASGYKGCLIGCTLPPEPVETKWILPKDEGLEPSSPLAGWHGRVEQLYGIPRPVGYLLDKIFESLPVDEGRHAWFAVESIEAIPVGADLTLVPSRLLLDVLTQPEPAAQRVAAEQVIGLYARRVAGDEPAWQEWLDAGRGVGNVVKSAAYAGACPKAAEAFAYAVGHADARKVDRYGWWHWVAERLIHHLATAPVPVKI